MLEIECYNGNQIRINNFHQFLKDFLYECKEERTDSLFNKSIAYF